MMKKCFRRIVVLCLLLAFGVSRQTVRACVDEVDSLQVSFLTCAPGESAYELFGHTALRVKDFRDGRDWVFNYGVFDFDTPNFALRFMLGQTDYCLGVSDYDSFVYTYGRRGRRVEEQVLNLNTQEKKKLLEALMANWMQKGWNYRYNFLYDNCTTRAFFQVKKAVEGKLVFPECKDSQTLTFRTILHEFSSEQSPWVSFGDDLVLGEEVDEPIGLDKQMFSPIYAQRILDKMTILAPDGSKRPLVCQKNVIVDVPLLEHEAFPITPYGVFATLLSIFMAIGYFELKQGHVFAIIDYLLMALMGIAGCIVSFLFFFSEHPAVGSNWLVILFNPLPLLFLPFKMWLDRKGKKDYSYVVLGGCVALCLFGASFNGQNLPSEMYLLALILLVRFLMNFNLRNENPPTWQ